MLLAFTVIGSKADFAVSKMDLRSLLDIFEKGISSQNIVQYHGRGSNFIFEYFCFTHTKLVWVHLSHKSH